VIHMPYDDPVACDRSQVAAVWAGDKRGHVMPKTPLARSCTRGRLPGLRGPGSPPELHRIAHRDCQLGCGIMSERWSRDEYHGSGVCQLVNLRHPPSRQLQSVSEEPELSFSTADLLGQSLVVLRVLEGTKPAERYQAQQHQ